MSNSPKKKPSDQTVIVTDKAYLNDPSHTYEPYLIQISGRGTGESYNLTGKHIKVGRDPTCQIALDDPHISRFHAEIISTENGEIVIRDVGSTNGVFVNGKRSTEHTLLDGDKILMGTRLYFRFCYQDVVDQTYQENLYRAANIDGLTQLYNKKYFIDAFSKEFSFSQRNKQPLSLMMVDIDLFKKINDTHGHVAGDMVLKSVGQYLLNNLRLENIAARFGGEEFAIAIRNATSEQALNVGERLRKDIEKSQISYRNKDIRVTISIGIATLGEEEFDTIEDFIQRADEYLYGAKRDGRNQTVNKKNYKGN